MLAELRENSDGGDNTVDIIGFSRGAAIALDFANLVDKEMQGATIRFLGLWDTVTSFGVPGNTVNIGRELTLPDNVERCYHAMSLDERRGNFPVTRVDGRPKGASRRSGFAACTPMWVAGRAWRYRRSPWCG